MFELHAVVASIVMFNILELIMEILPNYPTFSIANAWFEPSLYRRFVLVKRTKCDIYTTRVWVRTVRTSYANFQIGLSEPRHEPISGANCNNPTKYIC
jgi:hypothetical protein